MRSLRYALSVFAVSNDRVVASSYMLFFQLTPPMFFVISISPAYMASVPFDGISVKFISFF